MQCPTCGGLPTDDGPLCTDCGRGSRIVVPPHDDNTGAPCREVGPATLFRDLERHDCCHVCNDLGKTGCNCYYIIAARGRDGMPNGHHGDCVAQKVLADIVDSWSGR